MILSKIKNSLKDVFITSDYTRTAKELSLLSDRQLSDLGISRELLKHGASSYPWSAEVEVEVLEIPDNVTAFSTIESFKYIPENPTTPKTPKAA